ncbi:MAG: hypothetical protein RPU90_04380 [Candidatus Sedimenticola sp. (ex Thyasira tokunagai)]
MSSPQPQGRPWQRILDITEAISLAIDQALAMSNATIVPNARAELIRALLVQFWDFRYSAKCDIVTGAVRILIPTNKDKEIESAVTDPRNEIRELFNRSQLQPTPQQQPNVHFHINEINAKQVIMQQHVTKNDSEDDH